jgi:RNA polymerase sigma-54 factor
MAYQTQTLSLQQSQQMQMVLTPQLRQSLEMLQMPVLQLREMIQQELDRNPTIEEEQPEQAPSEATAESPGTTSETADSREMEFEKEFEALARLDEEWRDYFFQDVQSRPFTQDDEERRNYMMDSITERESLQQHLLHQLNLAGLSDADRKVGELIIGSLNDDGYLTMSAEDLAASAGVDLDHMKGTLAVVQDFHPVGVAARDLRECLLLQIERSDHPHPLAASVVSDHLERLGGHRIPEIAKALRQPTEAIEAAAAFIATLNPKPGALYTTEPAAYVEPEVIVQKVDGRYVVTVSDDQVPHIRINREYRNLLQDKSTPSEVRAYVQERVRSGAFLIKSINQRQRTIHRIASEIVDIQQEFFEHGISHLKPLTMADVAHKVGFHETTVSRTVSGKYMKTPVGTFDMKYFFTPGLRTSDGQQVSNKTVKDLIAGMVAAEDGASPLSDQEIMDRLKAQGIEIARRTVAKYRIVLRIPPSHARRQA